MGGGQGGKKDGANIAPKTVIHFGLHGMGVAPAGSDRENSGHPHLLIDADRRNDVESRELLASDVMPHFV